MGKIGRFDIRPRLIEISVRMPLFTSETAAQNGRLSGQVRRQRSAEAKAVAVHPSVQPDDEARKRRVLIQIDRVDEMLMKCPRKEFAALTAAKERLWNLVFPKAGVLRPKRGAAGFIPRPNVQPIEP